MFKYLIVSLCSVVALSSAGCSRDENVISFNKDQCFPPLDHGKAVEGNAILIYNPGIGTLLSNLQCMDQNVGISIYGDDDRAIREIYRKKFGNNAIAARYIIEFKGRLIDQEGLPLSILADDVRVVDECVEKSCP